MISTVPKVILGGLGILIAAVLALTVFSSEKQTQALSARAEETLNCGSDAVIDIAKQIVSSHPDNKLVTFLQKQSASMHSGAVKALDDERVAKAAAAEAAYNAPIQIRDEAQRKFNAAVNQCLQEHKQDGFADTCAGLRVDKTGGQRQETQEQIVAVLYPLMAAVAKAQDQVMRDAHNRGMTDVGLAIGFAYGEKLNQLWEAAKGNISYDLDTIRTKAINPDTGELSCQAVLTAELAEWGSAHLDVSYSVQKTTKDELYVEIYGLE